MKAKIIRIGLRLSLLTIAAFSLSLVASAQEGDAGPTTPPAPQAAAPIYEARCANCHGPAGQGDGPQATQVGLSMPDLTAREILRETTPARWFDIISNGVADAAMPPFGAASSNPLSETDRWNLVYYLYTLGTPAAQVAMGQALYDVNCADCHGSEGTGSADAPGFTDLTEMVARSQADLITAIADTNIAGHDLGLGDVELSTLADYVRTFSYNYAEPPASGPSSATDEPIPSPFTGGPGVISGQVVNGTTGAALPEGLEVTLRAFDMNAKFIDEISTTVAPDGSFRFEGIDPSVPAQLEPRIIYEDIAYYGDLEAAITLSPEQPEASFNITVYETTEDPGNVRIDRLHIVFDFALGRVQVAELYILANDGDRTFIGTLEEGTVRLTVPPDALSFQPGGDPNRYLTLADGIADTIPIPPGQSTAESILVYEMVYDGDLELSRPMPYDVSSVNIFVPADAGIEISGDLIQSGGLFQAQGVDLDTYVSGNLSAGERFTLRASGDFEVSSAPTNLLPRQTTGPNESQSIAIGLIALVGSLALSFLYWQGHLSLKSQTTRQDQQLALLQAIASLDDDFEEERVEEKPYQARRTKLKQELLELMEREE